MEGTGPEQTTHVGGGTTGEACHLQLHLVQEEYCLTIFASKLCWQMATHFVISQLQ